jgi:prephenate dehydrogenase
MVEMTCEEHDQQAANTQFITHTVGRILGEMKLKSTPINTKGYESLLNLVENTANDTFDLYYGLFMYNQVRGHVLKCSFLNVTPSLPWCWEYQPILLIFTSEEH